MNSNYKPGEGRRKKFAFDKGRQLDQLSLKEVNKPLLALNDKNIIAIATNDKNIKINNVMLLDINNYDSIAKFIEKLIKEEKIK